MLQIIGFLGCVYLLVKGLELLGRAARYSSETPFAVDMSQDDRTAAERQSRGQDLTASAGWLAIIAALAFAIWLYAQGDEIQTQLAPAQSYSECIRGADTTAEMLACSPD